MKVYFLFSYRHSIAYILWQLILLFCIQILYFHVINLQPQVYVTPPEKMEFNPEYVEVEVGSTLELPIAIFGSFLGGELASEIFYSLDKLLCVVMHLM